MTTVRPDTARPASPQTTLTWTAPIWLTLRTDLRRTWRAMLGLTLLLGLIGGVVLTAAAGARRTDTAYPRLLTWANASQLEVTPTTNVSVPEDFYQALARLPQVASMAIAVGYQVELPTADPNATAQVNALSSPDHAIGVSVDKVKVLSGRMFDPTAPDQAVIDPQLAALEHVGPGGTLRLLAVPNAGPDGSPDPAKAVPVSFLVTAVVTFDNQILPYGGTNTIAAAAPTALVSSFPVADAATQVSYGNSAAVQLRPGASVTAFTAAANALAARYKDTSAQGPGQVLINSNAEQVSATQRAIRPQAIALGAFAALAGLIALAVLGQLLSRQLAVDATEFPVLRALGMPRGALVALSLARLAVVTVTGGVIAVAVAIAASPLMPVGPARIAEPNPGIDVNIAVLGAGFAVIALAPLAVLGGSAWRAARQTAGPAGAAELPSSSSRPSGLRRALNRAGSVTGGLGAAMAFEPGHGRTAVPVRSALAGSVIALAALTAAAVFGASLIDLVSTPRLYGQNWDAELDAGWGGVPGALGAKVIAAAGPSIAGYAPGNYGLVSVGAEAIPAIGLDQGSAGQQGAGEQAGYLTVLAGRAPTAPDEIAFGAQTLRAIGGHVGETLTVTVDQQAYNTTVQRTMHIVGVVVLPNFGRGTFAPTDLGTGAVVTAAVLSERSTPGQTTLCITSATCYNFFLLRYRPGTDAAATAARLTAAAAQIGGCPPGQCPVITVQRPGDIEDYASVRDTPLVLAAVLIVLAVGTLAHVLLTTVRRRRRDLAVLKALGLTGPQVRGVVAWEATAFAAVALLLGLPLGVLAGRLAWAVFANGAGVSPAADVPVGWVLLVIPATLALANLIAAWPGRQAARLHPAAVLRAE